MYAIDLNMNQERTTASYSSWSCRSRCEVKECCEDVAGWWMSTKGKAVLSNHFPNQSSVPPRNRTSTLADVES
jgi:hypothetical protein